MGKAEVEILLTNLSDLNLSKAKVLKSKDVRKLKIKGLVDSGATGLCVPKKYIKQLGLEHVGFTRTRTANGKVRRKVYGDVLVNIMGRKAPFRATELPDDVPPLIGYLILEAFDYVVDSRKQKLIGNPEHGGKWILDEY